ncbi:hypothetical protein B0H63DRAFT_542303 [Podospora didyma]|uniref:Tyrosinase copper-binding domain-containing protein n=1 Tax=Podospora didyma TaxID=330526 RepID=A0AAE0U1S7_9PEZI|nr:hypothetical protein B0H63DRAFT_542303 [Podospora didyma]
MLLLSLVQGTALLAAASSVTAYVPASTIQTDVLATKALVNLAAYSLHDSNTKTCTLLNAAKRREWGSLSARERIAYTDAIKCLMNKPSHHTATEVPGAKSRYDDFVAVHMNQTLKIHGTANFLSWHRVFTWAYEQALRNECGYAGYQPYWNWGKSAFDPLGSPMFDGTSTSMSGNGLFAEHNCTNGLPTKLNCIPPGAGGGCVQTGPFANMSVNLGPISPALASADLGGVAPSFFAYNPRCLRRDVSQWVSSRWTRDIDSYVLITQHDNVGSFQTAMQGDFAAGNYGVHTGGHFTIGGDPGGDLFTSPGDPAFYLHHAQIDRTWWIWQNVNLKKLRGRTNAIAGTITLNNNPPSRNGTLEDIVDLGVNAAPVELGDVMSTMGLAGGPLCYVYV